MGYGGTNTYATRVINGEDITEDLKNMKGGLKQIIQTLKNGEQTPTLQLDITLHEFMQGYLKWREAKSTSPSDLIWREAKSTSPSGRHLGHHKALLRAVFKAIKENNKVTT